MITLLDRLFEHARFIIRHPEYKGVLTWFRYAQWLIAVIRRRTAVVTLRPFEAKIVVPPDVRGTARLVYLFGAGAEPELRVLARLISPGDTVVDVGAHYGSHTAVFATIVGPSGHVVAIEPAKPAFSTLLETIHVNGFSNVKAIRAAASDAPGRADLLLESDPSRNRIAERASDGEVAVITIDGLGLERVMLLKVDAEGHEDAVLAGSRETLRHRPIVMVEVSPESEAPSLLRATGYDLFEVRDGELVAAAPGSPAGLTNYICIPPAEG